MLQESPPGILDDYVPLASVKDASLRDLPKVYKFIASNLDAIVVSLVKYKQKVNLFELILKLKI
jgi:hypothetical protein